jgi:hypothetical protein
LFWRDRELLRGGVWLALGLCVKPIVAVLLLYLLLRRQWRPIGSALATLTILSVFTILLFGIATFSSYFTANPAARSTPTYVYSEPVNQSLLATILRTTGGTGARSPVTEPVYVVLAVALTAITSVLVYRLRTSDPEWALAALVPLALLLYPGTLVHYSLFLIVPLLLLWQHRDQLPIGLWGVVAFITLEYGLIGRGGGSIFAAIVLCWLLFVGVGFWKRGTHPVRLHADESLASFSVDGDIP